MQVDMLVSMTMDDGNGLCSSLDVIEQHQLSMLTQQCHFFLSDRGLEWSSKFYFSHFQEASHFLFYFIYFIFILLFFYAVDRAAYF